MPLIIITGYPCSGKTYRSLQILSDITNRIDEYNSTNPSSRPLSVQHLQSRHTVLDSPKSREEIYTSANAEKTARGAEFSAIKRAVNKDTVVIADSGNYIKGYRYQLWCEAKAAGTRCCVIHIASREDEVQKWNSEREEGKPSEEGGGSNGTAPVEKVTGQFMDKPESHTFLYGDRGGRAEDDDDGIPDELKAHKKQNTGYGNMESDLKSLYIDSGRTVDSTSDADFNSTEVASNQAEAETNSASERIKGMATHLSGRQEHPVQPPPRPIPPTPEELPTTSFPPPSSAYTPSTLHALISRYEPPSPFTRWDTPLFTIPSTDPQPPYIEIWTAIFPNLIRTPSAPDTTTASLLSQPNLPSSSTTSSTSYAPSITTATTTSSPFTRRTGTASTRVIRHAATVLAPASQTNALQTLEKSTQHVIKHLLTWATTNTVRDNTVGDEDVEVAIPLSISISSPSPSSTKEEESKNKNETIKIPIPAHTSLTLPALQRLRRRYVQMQRVAASRGGGTALSGDEEGIIRGFGKWVAEELGVGGGR